MNCFVRILIRLPDDRFLVIREEGRPFWNFPGGKVEPGESPVEAARRELREEVGLDVEALDLQWLDEGTYEIAGILWIGFWYVARRIRGMARPCEHGLELSFLTVDEMAYVPSLSRLLLEPARAAMVQSLFTHDDTR